MSNHKLQITTRKSPRQNRRNDIQPTLIAQKFEILLGDRRKALIPFFTAGFPSLTATERLALTAVSAGADILEIGMPFSDPLADGPAIQFSSQQALEHGQRMKDTLALVERIATKTDIPVVLMGYYNPLWAQGVSAFVRSAKSAGVAGLIVPDLPPEEATDLRIAAHESKVALTFLVAPTTNKERYPVIARASSGFAYAVTVAGVTGARSSFAKQTDSYLRMLKRRIEKPVVAGFGIASGASAKKMARYVDGVVAGSVFIDILRNNPLKQAEEQIGGLIGEIRKSLDSLDSGANT